MTWSKTDKKVDKIYMGWLVNGWLVYGWLIVLWEKISKLTSIWNKIEKE